MCACVCDSCDFFLRNISIFNYEEFWYRVVWTHTSHISVMVRMYLAIKTFVYRSEISLKASLSCTPTLVQSRQKNHASKFRTRNHITLASRSKTYWQRSHGITCIYPLLLGKWTFRYKRLQFILHLLASLSLADCNASALYDFFYSVSRAFIYDRMKEMQDHVIFASDSHANTFVNGQQREKKANFGVAKSLRVIAFTERQSAKCICITVIRLKQ